MVATDVRLIVIPTPRSDIGKLQEQLAGTTEALELVTLHGTYPGVAYACVREIGLCFMFT